MKNPRKLHPETLAAIVNDLQDIMYCDSGDGYVLDKDLDGADVIQDVSVLLGKYGLQPSRDNDIRELVAQTDKGDVLMHDMVVCVNNLWALKYGKVLDSDEFADLQATLDEFFSNIAPNSVDE